jgi:hypothetical protein
MTVRVYVVVAAGVTVTLPDATGETPPTPLSTLAEPAFVVVHDKVEDDPAAIVVGLAVKIPVGPCCGGG